MAPSFYISTSKGNIQKENYSRKYLRQRRSQIDNLNLKLEELENEDQIKLKANRRQQIVQIRVEIHEIEKRHNINN